MVLTFFPAWQPLEVSKIGDISSEKDDFETELFFKFNLTNIVKKIQ